MQEEDSGDKAAAATAAAAAGKDFKAGIRPNRQAAAALALLHRAPPLEMASSFERIVKIAPRVERYLADFLVKPLLLKRCPHSDKDFVASDFNLCGGGGGAAEKASYRSPWSGKCVPEMESAEEEAAARPSEQLAKLEKSFNDIFEAYRVAYYEGGVSSVYLWDEAEGFGGAFLIRKEVARGKIDSSLWESIHVVESKAPEAERSFHYKLRSTLRLHLSSLKEKAKRGEADLSAMITRQSEHRSQRSRKTTADTEAHIAHIGRMIEDAENSMRFEMANLYITKQREMLCTLREGAADVSLQLPEIE